MKKHKTNLTVGDVIWWHHKLMFVEEVDRGSFSGGQTVLLRDTEGWSTQPISSREPKVVYLDDLPEMIDCEVSEEWRGFL